MTVADAFQASGFRRSDAPVVAVSAISTIVAMTIYGALAPVVIIPVTRPGEGENSFWPVLALTIAIFVGTCLVAWVLATRLVVGRLPWPFGTRTERATDRPFLPYLLGGVSVSLSMSLFDNFFPTATGLHAISGSLDSWVRIVAPAELAAEFIVALVVALVAYPAGVLIVFVWHKARVQPVAPVRSE